jgi:hypothetical protein
LCGGSRAEYAYDLRIWRTNRPLSAGSIRPQQVLRIGLWLSLLGITWAAAMSALYGLVIIAGWFFDVVIYVIGLLSGGLLLLAVYRLLRPSEQANFTLLKCPSLYMMFNMLLIALVA